MQKRWPSSCPHSQRDWDKIEDHILFDQRRFMESRSTCASEELEQPIMSADLTCLDLAASKIIS